MKRIYTFRLEPEDVERWKAQARESGISLSEWVRLSVQRWCRGLRPQPGSDVPQLCYPVDLPAPIPISKNDLFARWEAEFQPLLGSTARWEGFSFIAKDQLEREKVWIVETGTCRHPGDWNGDGQSTRVWDWIVAQKGGIGVSVDCEMASVETAQRLAPHMHVFCQDSVSFLRGYLPYKPTLLYLDSRDWGPGAEIQACMQQVAELAAIWDWLPPGCLVASDDSHSPDQGKPALTRRLLHILGIEPVLDSYIVCWRKP